MKNSKGLGKILSKWIGSGASGVSLTPQEKVKQELDQYLLHPQLAMEESPLEWWMREH